MSRKGLRIYIDTNLSEPLLPSPQNREPSVFAGGFRFFILRFRLESFKRAKTLCFHVKKEINRQNSVDFPYIKKFS